MVSGGGSSGRWCEVVEVSAGGERWCSLVMVVRGVGGLRWRLRWWKFEHMVRGSGGLSFWCDVVET